MKTKYFDVDKALSKAMETFWANGYEASSIQRLQEDMGIKRQSLYNTYGSKHELFLNTLDFYHDNIIVKNMSSLLEAESPKEAIRSYFYQRWKDTGNDEVITGCLVTNTSTELGLTDEAVKRKTKRTLTFMESIFFKAVLKSQQLNEISKDKDAKLLAIQLLNHAQGFFVMSKSGVNRNKLKMLIDEILKILD